MPDVDEASGDDDMQALIERLGRLRPVMFTSSWMEIGFCFSLMASMIMAEYFVSGFNLILPTLATTLNIPAQAQTWPASVFSLITGAFLLPFGRLADIYGGRVIFLYGLYWFLFWSFIGGFSYNQLMLNFCRALQGLGPAAFLPAGVMLLGRIYRPGPRKNLVFSLYGACAPIGFFSGIFIGGVCGEYIPWGWYFWIGSALLLLISMIAFLTVPFDRKAQRSNGVAMDWLGFVTIVPGLIFLVFAITASSLAHEGWRTPYIYVTFTLGCILLAGAVYIEGWIAKMPLLPFDLFQVKCMKPLCAALFLTYGVFGIYLFYASFYIEKILHKTSLQTTAWFTPMAAGGMILATAGGFLLHLLPGTLLLIFSAVGYIVCVLLFAVMPDDPSYWAYVFPAMIAGTVGVDIMFSTSNVFITTSMPEKRQGLAGALINCLVFLGISLCLGVADIVQTATAHLGLKQSYKYACWFGVGCAGFSLVLLVGFVRIGRAKSSLTVDERAEREAETEMTSPFPRPSDSVAVRTNNASTSANARPGPSNLNAPSRVTRVGDSLNPVYHSRRPAFERRNLPNIRRGESIAQVVGGFRAPSSSPSSRVNPFNGLAAADHFSRRPAFERRHVPKPGLKSSTTGEAQGPSGVPYASPQSGIIPAEVLVAPSLYDRRPAFERRHRRKSGL